MQWQSFRNDQMSDNDLGRSLVTLPAVEASMLESISLPVLGAGCRVSPAENVTSVSVRCSTSFGSWPPRNRPY